MLYYIKFKEFLKHVIICSPLEDIKGCLNINYKIWLSYEV